MERQLYLTEAPLSQSPDTTIIPQKQRLNFPVKSLNNPNDRRNQISKKMLCNFPLESYYDDKKIKPGIYLYKIIMEAQDRRRQGQFSGPFLQLNLHPTICFTDNVNTMIHYQNGIIKTVNYISYQQYMAKLSITQEMIKNQQQISPMIMTKCCNGISFQNNIIMNNQISSKIIPRSQNVISTKFIMPYACYPNIIRLYYTPKQVKNLKRNIGYKVINRKQMTEEAYKKKHRLSNQFMVNIQNQDSYIATLMKGKSLQLCQNMAESLCVYLEHALLIKVNQVVIDFIVDEQKTIYFNDIKAINSKNKTKVWEIGTQQQIVKLAFQNNNQIMCRLCGMLYTKQQMQKLVTNKLIYELNSHLQNRGKKLSNIPHMKKEGLSNVCYLCYQLIKAEHTLINVERQFSELMNIRQNTVERVQSKQTKQQQLFFYNEEQFQMLGQQTSKYKKWRLFFYIEKLKRIPQLQMNEFENIELVLDMKFQNQRQKFTKILKNQNFDPASIPEMNMTKNMSKSIRTVHQNAKRQSSSSRVNVLRVQSAMPHKQRYKQNENRQNEQYQYIEIQNQVQVPQKNKSYFNDQTTCITHSQSYFSSLNGEKSHHMQSLNNMSINKHLNNITQNGNYTNNLDSLYEDPGEDSYINMTRNFNFTKKCSSNSTNNNVLNNSSVPQNIKIDKVKMFIFYTKAHQNQGKNILNEEEMEFSLAFNGLNSNSIYVKDQTSFKFAGNSSTLKCLKNKETCQRHSLQVYLFDHGMKYCNLQLTVGMICDGVYEDQGLDLQKNNNLYWGKTYSCEPLPDEWMQVFTNGEEVPKGNMDKVFEYLEDNNFRTSPPKLIQKSNSVNYLKSFQQFSKTIEPLTLNNNSSKNYNINTITRPFSGIPASQSTSLLKKSSMIRCKTAISRNTNSTNNLLSFNAKQKNLPSSNRGNIRSKCNTAQVVENQLEENDLGEFGV